MALMATVFVITLFGRKISRTMELTNWVLVVFILVTLIIAAIVLVPLSALVGAAFLAFADVGARTLAAPAELPVGVITAFVGAPFFLFLLRRTRTGYEL